MFTSNNRDGIEKYSQSTPKVEDNGFSPRLLISFH